MNEYGHIGFDNYYLLKYSDVHGYSIENLYVVKITKRNIICCRGSIWDGNPSTTFRVALDDNDLFNNVTEAKEALIKSSDYQIETFNRKIANLNDGKENIRVARELTIMKKEEIPATGEIKV